MDYIPDIFLHYGASEHWIIIPPADQKHPGEMLSTLCGSWYGPNWSYPICNQFVRHLSIWVPPAILTQWNIGYDEVE